MPPSCFSWANATMLNGLSLSRVALWPTLRLLIRIDGKGKAVQCDNSCTRRLLGLEPPSSQIVGDSRRSFWLSPENKASGKQFLLKFKAVECKLYTTPVPRSRLSRTDHPLFTRTVNCGWNGVALKTCKCSKLLTAPRSFLKFACSRTA